MKNFFIGLVIGIVIGGMGGYAFLKEKVTKIATKENTEKVVKATQNFSDTIKEVVQQQLIMFSGCNWSVMTGCIFFICWYPICPNIKFPAAYKNFGEYFYFFTLKFLYIIYLLYLCTIKLKNIYDYGKKK